MTARSSVSIAAVLVLAGCFSWPGRPEDPQIPTCMMSADFGNPQESAYVLPFPVGSEYEVFQTYCGPVSHGKDGQMSIDFLMPVGSEVVAARAGTVRDVVDDNRDFGRAFNYIYIEHEDHTAAFYGHLAQHGVRVRVGEKVEAGQVIALSGSSGTSLAHLHFGVSRQYPVRHPDDFPANFLNSDGDLDERGGLKYRVTYRALPYAED